MRTATVLAAGFLVLAVTGAGCGQKEAPESVSGYSFKDLEAGVALDVPADWQRKDNIGEYRAVFYGPIAGAGPGFQTEVRLMVLPRTGIKDRDHYLTLCARQAELLEGAKDIDARFATHANGEEAVLIECEYTELGGQPVRMKQYAILTGRRQYVVTAVVAAGAADQLMPQLQPILDSLTFW